MKTYHVPGLLLISLALFFTGCDTGSDATEIQWVRVEAGSFTMGSNEEEAYTNEQPEHEVYLDAYSISLHEITNHQFCGFLNAVRNDLNIEVTDNDYVYYIQVEYDRNTLYATDGEEIDYNGSRFFINQGYDNHPVIGATWYGADAFCEHYGYRLPTEAQWEKAARGTDKKKYPWGDTEPGSKHANFDDNENGTTEVGSYPDGASPCECLDMAGNAEEWCSDFYDHGYYSESPDSNPTGPDEGSTHVVRGGNNRSDAKKSGVAPEAVRCLPKPSTVSGFARIDLFCWNESGFQIFYRLRLKDR